MFSKRVLEMKYPSLYGIAKLAQGLKDVIYLNVGEPDFKTPEHIIEAAKRALDSGYTHYTPDSGIYKLREAIAEKESEKLKKELKVDNVLVTIGATQAIFSAIMALVDPGQEVIVPDPWYPGYVRAIILAGGKPVPVRLIEEKEYQMNIDELNEKISENTKVIILATPNNPTGALLDKKTLKGIAEIAADNKIFVISDEVYDKFVYESEFHSIGEFSEVDELAIIVNSFSKTYAMTGWRIGYAVASKPIIEEMLKVTLASALSPNSIAQYAALEALKGPQEPVERMIREFRKRRDTILEELSKIKEIRFVKPKGAFYVFPNTSKLNIDDVELVKYLVQRARVVTSPGYPFFGPSGKGHIRIAYTVSVEKLREACSRIREAIAEIKH